MKLTVKRLLAALETQGVPMKTIVKGLKRIEKPIREIKMGKIHIIRANRMLRRNGYCAMYATKSTKRAGGILFVHEAQLLPWPFSRPGGAGEHPRSGRVLEQIKKRGWTGPAGSLSREERVEETIGANQAS